MYLFAASSTTLGLPSSALDVSCFPREPIRMGAPEQVAASVPITATVLPQLSAGPAASSSTSTSTVRLLEWTEAAAPPSGSGVRFRISEYAPPNWWERSSPRAPNCGRKAWPSAKMARPRREVAMRGPNSRVRAPGPELGHCVADLPQNPPEDPPQDPPEDDGTCQCQACGPQQGAGPDPGSSNDGCPQLFQERSVIVENSGQNNSCTNASELLKPMKKRKRKEYQSPCEEESEPEAMEKQEEEKDPEEQPTASTPESEEWNSSQPAPGEKKEGWSWDSYLEEQKAITAPVSLFKDYQAVTHNKNGFRLGMKLEGIDPQHPSMYFILTVAEVCGYRLRLHFDGYSECHDFWINANSPDIHPAGWFEKTGHKLQPPKGLWGPQACLILLLQCGVPSPQSSLYLHSALFIPPRGLGYKEEEFSWSQYLRSTRAQAAPKHLFVSQSHTRGEGPTGQAMGLKGKLVSPVPSLLPTAEILSSAHDPRGTCSSSFASGSWASPSWPGPGRGSRASCPQSPPPLGFQVGMKLEAVDRMNPSLICVASVTDVVDGRFLVHFDNWDDTYDYWCDPSSPYIHPVGWCQKQGKPLTPPQDYPDPDSFCWEKYLEETGASAVPTWAFKVRPPHGFLVNMKLEAVDRRNPALIRVASVEDVEDHRIKVALGLLG
ncbi:Lethalmalignant brain tumor-like protein 1 [Camelus dromedarius]|uniref:Lethalmalignant brain tumor-like protein 1 n=1 Tax=Camelus dromedarius TaxID=9838 RepID=A0A5N4CUF5_CAMDR|nr:Lethalmalignant brain tumor-like protein 1 [Camelus dromedarius]